MASSGHSEDVGRRGRVVLQMASQQVIQWLSSMKETGKYTISVVFVFVMDPITTIHKR